MEEQRLLFFPSLQHPNGREMDVAEILLHLPDMILQSESSPLPIPLSLVWGRKRKRSKDAQQPQLVKQASAIDGSSVRPRPLPSNAAVKAETSSPDTPLAFMPSESDENPQHSTRKLLCKRKRETREEWRMIIDKLIEKKKRLQMELQKVELHYSKLNDLNLELKARKQELMKRLRHNQEEGSRPEIVPNLNNPVLQLSQPAPPATNQVHYQYHQRTPIPANTVVLYPDQMQLIMDRTAQTQRIEICESYRYTAYSTTNVSVASRAVPLNSYRPYDHRSWMDHRKPRADQFEVFQSDPAEAKQRRLERLEICRGKKPRCHAR